MVMGPYMVICNMIETGEPKGDIIGMTQVDVHPRKVVSPTFHRMKYLSSVIGISPVRLMAYMTIYWNCTHK